jgi:hypothetical protein
MGIEPNAEAWEDHAADLKLDLWQCRACPAPEKKKATPDSRWPRHLYKIWEQNGNKTQG